MPASRTFPDQPIVGVGAVVIKDDQVLLIKRGKTPRKGEWSLPGGGVELGETTSDAIKREIQEETGLKTELAGIIDTVDYIERTDTGAVSFHYVLIDYLVYYCAGTLTAGSDADDARFFTVDAALALPLWHETKRIIRAAQAMDQKRLPANMSNDQQKPSSRSFVGMAAMVIGLTLYAFLAAGIGNLISDWHLAIQMSYYLVAGLVWLYPAKKLLQWMGGQ